MLKLKLRNVVYLMIYAVPNVCLNFGIVYVINNAMAGKEIFLKEYTWVVFVAMILYSYLHNIIFQRYLNKFSFKLLYDSEKRVFAQVLNAPLRKLEKLGSQRFYTAVEDLRIFSFLPYTVTHTVNSLLMLLLCLLYMFTLSLASAMIVVGLIIAVAGCYFYTISTMSKKVARLREYNEHYYGHVDDVMKGFKELKLSFFRRESLMNRFLIPNRNDAMELDFRNNFVFLSINLISQYGLYFVVSVILFIFPRFELLSRTDVIAYVVIILFMSGPINNLINLQQMYTRFIVSNKRLKAFVKDFEIVDHVHHIETKEKCEFQSVALRDVSFSYHNTDGGESQFALGPVSLTIEQGETIFIVGGNGSGKSTFINVLTGLYKPTAGQLELNDGDRVNVTEKMQSLTAAVFTDNHIFSHNYDEYVLENNEQYVELLKTMQLDGIVQDDKEASARRKFSKGQSKRMSLIFALLEKKPVLVLDEWAADQDPHFRKYFYEQLLPKLKAEGKTIIAVTHDDAYFHVADRIIKFDYGVIVKDLRVTSKEEIAENIWM